MKLKIKRVGVISGGAWGTALAQVAAAKPARHVSLLMRNRDDIAAINATHVHVRRLPGVTLRPNIVATDDPSALADADLVIVAVPSHAFGAAVKPVTPHLRREMHIVVATKGVPRADGKDAALGDYLPGLPYFLSGPTFAADVARELPSAIVLAGFQHGDVVRLGNALATAPFRIYFSTDITGVRLCGPMKNVLAIACGIAEGMKLGDSARAALVTRGAAELVRLGRAHGGHGETLHGLAGTGDLILTATSRQSRNFSLGVALGEGLPLAAALAKSSGVCEGVGAARDIAILAGEYKLDLPIASATARILDGMLTPAGAMEELLERPLTTE